MNILMRFYLLVRPRKERLINRCILSCGALLFANIASVSVAHPPASVAVGQSSDDPPTRKPITAAAEPDPALKYEFWPPASQRKEINATTLFSRAVLIEGQISTADRRGEVVREFEELIEGGWKPEHVAKVQTMLEPYAGVFSELERATDCMLVDYPIRDEELSLAESYGLILPEIQQSRQLARLLSMRAHVEMHRGDWKAFSRTIQTMFRLADIVRQAHESLVADLVSLAIVGLTHQVIEQASGVSDSPNFYWALAAVPTDIFETRSSIEYEVANVLGLLPGSSDLPDTPIGPIKARQLLSEMTNDLNRVLVEVYPSKTDSDPTVAPLIAGLMLLGMGEPSRTYLREATEWGDRADQLSNSEATLRAIVRQVRRKTDNYAKWIWLPPHLRRQHIDRADQVFLEGEDFNVSLNPTSVILKLLLPAVKAAGNASYRTHQTHTRLITLQAIRMASMNGELPDDLNELVPPAWPDPVTNQNFDYQKTGKRTAVFTREKWYPNDSQTNLQLELVK